VPGFAALAANPQTDIKIFAIGLGAGDGGDR
jgi:hypothetical protein